MSIILSSKDLFSILINIANFKVSVKFFEKEASSGGLCPHSNFASFGSIPSLRFVQIFVLSRRL
jgi:hypothetical protein